MGKASSRACTLLFRLLALAATATATIVMATSHEKTTFFNIQIEAKFQHTPAFKFFAIANAIGALYSLIILFVPPVTSYSRLVLASDMVITMLLTAAVAAAGAVGQVGKKGNEHAGWLPICGQIPKFCDQVMGSLVCGFIAVLVYLVLLFHTIHTHTS
ncbi:CASP-like protein 1C2 [Iris pallida]|uniref:CASP-like protein n=1 Tax=Iris pallida TaxID=29817 RepID=A0AAX6GZR3_IRIPA|nr:CASP-like protein 1C2 [Iris pallida]